MDMECAVRWQFLTCILQYIRHPKRLLLTVVIISLGCLEIIAKYIHLLAYAYAQFFPPDFPS